VVGDEFVGLLQLKSPQDIEGAARRLKAAAEQCEIEVNGEKINCQSAIGITVVRSEDDIKSLIHRADRYMYEAKKINGNQIVSDANAEDDAD
jgi:diguanylate cyclase (GGDEF)-like protein